MAFIKILQPLGCKIKDVISCDRIRINYIVTNKSKSQLITFKFIYLSYITSDWICSKMINPLLLLNPIISSCLAIDI